MPLIERLCPVCSSSERSEVVILKQDHFTKNNPSYNLGKIPALGLSPEQEYPIVRCVECGLIYSLYHLDDEGEKIVYNEIIDSGISKRKVLTIGRRLGDLKRWHNLLSLTGKGGKDSIAIKLLDYGCGWGTFLQVAHGPGVTAIGFDVTSWKIEFARSNGATVCESEEELLKHAPFDLCLSTSVLEHLHHPGEAVKTISSLMKPGGFAYITCVIGDVYRDESWNDIKGALERNKPVPKEINPWEHLNYFTNETFLNLMTANDFMPVDGPEEAGDGIKTCVKTALKRKFPFLKNKHAVSGFWKKV